MPDEFEADITLARRLRHQLRIDRLDYLRAVSRLAQTMTQHQIMRAVGTQTRTEIEDLMADISGITQPRPGFSGESPYEIIERYAIGQLTRDQLIDELSRYDYSPAPTTDGIDSLLPNRANTVADIARASHDGLIDDSTYTDIQAAIPLHRRPILGSS